MRIIHIKTLDKILLRESDTEYHQINPLNFNAR